jgi:hypothetical protein
MPGFTDENPSIRPASPPGRLDVVHGNAAGSGVWMRVKKIINFHFSG